MKVKICGLTSVDDALAAAEAGADWLGLNFYPPSPRFVNEDVARAIVQAVGSRAECVGLFVNRPPDEVRNLADRVGLKIVQLHGSEPVSDLPPLASLQVVRAFRIANGESLNAMREYVQSAHEVGCPLHAVLVDAYVPGQVGGTGQTIATEIVGPLSAMIREFPPMILAGGLTPENVAEMIARVKPWMVDVAGGVESSPARKDPVKMVGFVKACQRDEPDTSLTTA